MLLLTRACLAYFRLGALFEASDISTTSEPTVPSGFVSFGPADPVCARRLSCKGSLTPRPEVGSLRSPSYGQPLDLGYVGSGELGVAVHVHVAFADELREQPNAVAVPSRQMVEYTKLPLG